MYYSESERNIIRNFYQFNTDDIVISYIGKFNKNKQPDLIFDIINKFERNYISEKKLKLLFIGPKDNEYMKIFNKKLLKLKEKIDITIDDTKPFTELRKYFSASDICIFPKETTFKFNSCPNLWLPSHNGKP